MDGYSLNVVQEQISKLKELFPEVIAEDKIDWERLRATLGEDIFISNERYVLNWAGKSDAFRTLQTGTTATLQPIDAYINGEYLPISDTFVAVGQWPVTGDGNESRATEHEPRATDNIFIEGENLEVLKVLQKANINISKYKNVEYIINNAFLLVKNNKGKY